MADPCGGRQPQFPRASIPHTCTPDCAPRHACNHAPDHAPSHASNYTHPSLDKGLGLGLGFRHPGLAKGVLSLIRQRTLRLVADARPLPTTHPCPQPTSHQIRVTEQRPYPTHRIPPTVCYRARTRPTDHDASQPAFTSGVSAEAARLTWAVSYLGRVVLPTWAGCTSR